MGEKNNRSYGLDLLRVLLAIMVITLHFNAGATGQVLSHSTVFPWNIIVLGVTTLCYPAVNCYILICGFFSWNKRNAVEGKLFRLWLSLLFFSLIGYIIVSVATSKFSPVDLVYRFFPLIRGQWWYMVDYFALIILSPFINRLIENLSRDQHKRINIINFVLFSIIPMLNKWNDQLGVNYGYGLLWFIALYFIGSYIAKYQPFSAGKFKLWLQSPIVLLFLYFIVSIMVLIVDKLLRIFGIEFYLNPYNSVFSLLQSVCLFMVFVNMKITNKTVVICLDRIAPLTLASYLFHCQEDMDSFIWKTIAPWKYANSNRLIFVYLASVLGIFLASIILERIRIAVFGGVNNKIISACSKNTEMLNRKD